MRAEERVILFHGGMEHNYQKGKVLPNTFRREIRAGRARIVSEIRRHPRAAVAHRLLFQRILMPISTPIQEAAP